MPTFIMSATLTVSQPTLFRLPSFVPHNAFGSTTETLGAARTALTKSTQRGILTTPTATFVVPPDFTVAGLPIDGSGSVTFIVPPDWAVTGSPWPPGTLSITMPPDLLVSGVPLNIPLPTAAVGTSQKVKEVAPAISFAATNTKISPALRIIRTTTFVAIQTLTLIAATISHKLNPSVIFNALMNRRGLVLPWQSVILGRAIAARAILVERINFATHTTLLSALSGIRKLATGTFAALSTLLRTNVPARVSASLAVLLTKLTSIKPPTTLYGTLAAQMFRRGVVLPWQVIKFAPPLRGFAVFRGLASLAAQTTAVSPLNVIRTSSSAAVRILTDALTTSTAKTLKAATTIFQQAISARYVQPIKAQLVATFTRVTPVPRLIFKAAATVLTLLVQGGTVLKAPLVAITGNFPVLLTRLTQFSRLPLTPSASVSLLTLAVSALSPVRIALTRIFAISADALTALAAFVPKVPLSISAIALSATSLIATTVRHFLVNFNVAFEALTPSLVVSPKGIFAAASTLLSQLTQARIVVARAITIPTLALGAIYKIVVRLTIGVLNTTAMAGALIKRPIEQVFAAVSTLFTQLTPLELIKTAVARNLMIPATALTSKTSSIMRGVVTALTPVLAAVTRTARAALAAITIPGVPLLSALVPSIARPLAVISVPITRVTTNLQIGVKSVITGFVLTMSTITSQFVRFPQAAVSILAQAFTPVAPIKPLLKQVVFAIAQTRFLVSFSVKIQSTVTLAIQLLTFSAPRLIAKLSVTFAASITALSPKFIFRGAATLAAQQLQVIANSVARVINRAIVTIPTLRLGAILVTSYHQMAVMYLVIVDALIATYFPFLRSPSPVTVDLPNTVTNEIQLKATLDPDLIIRTDI